MNQKSLLLLSPKITFSLRIMDTAIFHLVCSYILLSSSILFHYAHLISSSKIFGNTTDQLALLSFKKGIISDPLSITSSWNESTHFCNWIGITCGRRHDQRVITMDLRSSRLVGTLSPAVGNLSFLRQLRLDNNSFTGQIPQEIGKLSRLQTLVLRNNSFSGEIPRNISRCSKLIMLHLGRNKLKGNIPVEFASLNKLEEMHVFFNNLSGEIPSCFGNFSSIRVISLLANNFHGTMPDFLGNLGNLQILELAKNNLSGAIPALVFNLSSLRNLELSLNQLEGPIPSSMGFTLPKLEVFNLGANQLTGLLPASVSNLTNLKLFAVDTNNFSGEVPSFGSSKNLYWLGLSENRLGKGKLDGLLFMSFLQNCSALQILQIDDNQFGGVIPRYFGNMSSLLYLTMSRNLIHGIIPVEISQLHSLQELSLQQNHLTGEIPDSIGELELLNELHLSDNQLSGKIPSCIGNLTILSKLSLGANNLHGSIPSSLGKIKFLSLLNLSRNHLSGEIPKEILQLPEALLHLDLSRNHITGSLAGSVNGTIRLKNLVYLRLSNNNLSGEIPSSFKILTSLTELYVDNNYLQGAIPPSLSSLTSLEFIDLSHNKFVSKIPDFFASLRSLKYLNLSYNDLEGELPSDGVFRNKSRFSVTGNNKLCGGIPEFKLPKCPKKDPSSGKSSRMMILIIALVVGGIVGITAVAILLWRYNIKRKQRVADNQGSTVVDAVIPRVTYQGLQKATNGFSLENLIGWGNFSSVYKGILDESVDGIKQIAVKVLKLQMKGASKSFVAECEALRHIRHRNLVKLLTCCSSIDHQGHDFKAIIYELMINGNLHNWLHQSCWKNSTTDEENHKQPRSNLNIKQRLAIVIDVATALDYLHNQSGMPLIHCDLKPSNVLLNEEFVAHLGDFGLARFTQADAATHVQSSSSTVKGTLGYIPPEYAAGSKLSTYGDMYSYGILVLETFTGKSPTDEIFKDGLNLHDFVKMAIPEQVLNVCDPTLVDRCLENKNVIRTEKCLCSVFRIGIACSMESAEARMDIAHVLKELKFIRDDL
ncbi:putative LRR receptor-like serine/threonine-protein kinase [Capsicum annuum]